MKFEREEVTYEAILKELDRQLISGEASTDCYHVARVMINRMIDNGIAKVKPGILSFQELRVGVKKGSIRIPNFQREFVWEQSQIINLLDSIYRHYPIGSFL